MVVCGKTRNHSSRPEAFLKLNSDQKKRYLCKLSLIDGIDSYSLEKDDFTDILPPFKVKHFYERSCEITLFKFILIIMIYKGKTTKLITSLTIYYSYYYNSLTIIMCALIVLLNMLKVGSSMVGHSSL